MKLWERYFISDVLRLFFGFLFAFYFLYVVVDYSTNSGKFAQDGLHFGQILFYYLCHFVKRLEVLVPFSLMCATIRTLCLLNMNNEIVALSASGVSLKRFSRPFLLIGLVGVAFLYLNFEWTLPASLDALKNLASSKESRENTPRGEQVSSFALKDGSTLIYQGYDEARERFFDVYWLQSADHVYRIQYLYPEEIHSVGTLVDELERGPDGRFEIIASHNSFLFDDLGFSDDILERALTRPEDASISSLWHDLPKRDSSKQLSDQEVLVISSLHYKLSLPWICLLVVLAPLPFCVRYTRHLEVFFLYGAAIIAFLCFFTVLSASVVLGESQVIPPWLGSWGVFLLSYAIALWYYIRMR